MDGGVDVSHGFYIFQLILCGSNLEAVYDKVVPMRLLPTEYLPDDYTGPTNGSLKDLISKLFSYFGLE